MTQRLLRFGWLVAFIGLVAYAGRLWIGNLRGEASGIVSGLVAIVGGNHIVGRGIHPASEAAVTIGFIAIWVALVLTPRSALARVRLSWLPSGAFGGVLAFAGLASLVAIVVVDVMPIAVPNLLVGVTVLTVAGVASLLRLLPVVGSDPSGEGEAPEERNRALAILIVLPVIVALGLLVLAIGRDVVYLAFFRPPASGDEAFFWWTSTAEVKRLGLYGYLSNFPVAGYPPGYPLASNLLIGWVPDVLFAAAGRALPFVFGFAALWMALREITTARRLLTPVAGLYYVLAYVLFFKHTWIHSLYFELWYGEAFATIAFAAILVLLDSAARRNGGRADGALFGLAGVGLGALGAISKPPLSFLLLPAILPTIVLGTFLLSLRRRQLGRTFVTAALGVAAGAGLAQGVWGGILSSHGASSFYGIDLRAIFLFHPEGSFSKLVPYFFENYQVVWFGFIVTSALALLHDWRRFLPFWLVSVGMIASVFVLYLGVWSGVEHESGARYILHGAYGWIIFSLGALASPLSTTIEQSLSWLSSRAFRLTSSAVLRHDHP